MRKGVRFFDINIEFSGESASITEKDGASGKYCKRRDVEPMLLSYEKRIQQYKKVSDEIVKHLKGKGFINLEEAEKDLYRRLTTIV